MSIKNTKDNYFVDDTLYRGLSYKKDINRDTLRLIKKYRNKIGYQLGGEIQSMLSRRGEVILMIANAGGGKTYVILKEMNELSKKKCNDNVRYIITVPTFNQSNQNEKSDVLSMFKAKSIVGSRDGRKKVEVNSMTDRLFSCVYDKALDLVEILKSNGHEVVLVIDECHKLIADNNFREEAITNLEKARDLSDQVIMMTATPRMNLETH